MTSNELKPLVPTAGEIAMLGLGLLAVILCVAAVISLAGDRQHAPGQRLGWLIIIVTVPVAGPVLWLTFGARRTPDASRLPGELSPAGRFPPAGSRRGLSAGR